MKVFRAFGIGVLIIILKFLIPEIFSAFESTLVLFFDTLQNGLSITNDNLLASPTSLLVE